MSEKSPFDDEMMFSTITLQRIMRIVSRKHITDEAVATAICENTIFEMYRDSTLQTHVMQIVTYLWGKVNKEVAVKYPADWKEAFKERWYPKWLLKRYPVVYVDYVIKAYELYPDIVVPNKSYSIVLAVEHQHKYDPLEEED